MQSYRSVDKINIFYFVLIAFFLAREKERKIGREREKKERDVLISLTKVQPARSIDRSIDRSIAIARWRSIEPTRRESRRFGTSDFVANNDSNYNNKTAQDICKRCIKAKG